MRFRFGPVPDDPEFHPAEGGWTRLREPSFGRLLLLAIPLSVVVAAGLSLAWVAVALGRGIEGEVGINLTPRTAFLSLPVLAVVILAHEFLHVVALPRGGWSAATTLGLWPQTLTPYVSHVGEMSRGRLIMYGVAPFLVLSVAPLLVGFCLSSAPSWAIVLSTLNGFGSSGDLIGVALVASQVPSSARVRNKGRETWWRRPA